MEERRGNGNTVLLTVIGVATLLVALVGATFAYFTATVGGNTTQQVDVTTTELAGLTVNTLAMQGGVAETYPGWVGYQVVTVEGTGAATAKGNYTLSLTGTIAEQFGSDVEYTVYKSNDKALATLPAANAFANNLTAGTLQDANNQYYIDGASFTAPEGYTAIKSNQTLTAATVPVDTDDFIGTAKVAYVIAYKYKNNASASQNTAMAQQFTASMSARLNTLTTAGTANTGA